MVTKSTVRMQLRSTGQEAWMSLTKSSWMLQ